MGIIKEVKRTMPEEYNGWKLVKKYENFGLYTNGKWNECFSKFDVGLVERRNARGEIQLFNDSVGGKNG